MISRPECNRLSQIDDVVRSSSKVKKSYLSVKDLTSEVRSKERIAKNSVWP